MLSQNIITQIPIQPNQNVIITEAIQTQTQVKAICDVCGEQACALPRTLKYQGWGLYKDFAFCPIHEEMV